MASIRNVLATSDLSDIKTLAVYYGLSLDQSFGDLTSALVQKIQAVHGTMNPAQVWEKYGEQLTAKADLPLAEIQQSFLAADPTQNKKHVEWLVTSYLNGGISLLEDLGRASSAIESFTWLVKNGKIRADDVAKYQNSLHHFCGIAGCKRKNKDAPGLEDFLDTYKTELSARQQKTVETALSSDADVIADTPEFKLLVPKTVEASCKYGAGTRWCTAAKQDNAFVGYNSQGPLYILIPANPAHPGEKYQLHFETRSIMNEKDRDVKVSTLVAKFPTLQNISKIKSKINYSLLLENLNNYEFSKKLLEETPDVNVQALLEEAMKEDNYNKQVVELLIKLGADVNHVYTDSNGRKYTLFNKLLKARYVDEPQEYIIDIIKTLIEAGINVNITAPVRESSFRMREESSGYTPLMMAATTLTEPTLSSVIKLLLDAGANPHALNRQKQFAFQILFDRYANDYENISIDSLKLLINAKTIIRADDFKRIIDTIKLPEQYRLELIQSMLDAGTNVNMYIATDIKNNTIELTALMYAALKNSPLLVKLLLASGADPNIINDAGHKAIDYAKTDTVKKLLQDASV